MIVIIQLDKRVGIEPCSPTATIQEEVFFWLALFNCTTEYHLLCD